MIVARHPGAVKRATSYAERLRLNIAVIHGEEKDDADQDDGRNLPASTEVGKLSSSSSSSGLKLLPGESLVSVDIIRSLNFS